MNKAWIVAVSIAAAMGTQASLLTTTPTGTAGAQWTTVVSDTVVGTLAPVDPVYYFGLSGPFGESPVIAADGSGFTQTNGGAEWENYGLISNEGSRHRIDYYIGNATQDFTLSAVNITISGVAGNGITAVAHYQTGGLWNHDVIALNSDGVNTINLSQTLNFTTGSSPLSNSRFAITFHEPETITVGDNAVIESVEIIPEPATLGLVAIFGGGVLFIRRRFMI